MHPPRWLVVLFALSAACGGPSGEPGPAGGPAGRTLHVHAALGDDANDGSETHPLRTVTQALALALPGDAVRVAPGTYDVLHGEVFPVKVPPAVSLVGDEPHRGAGPTPTLLLGGGPFPGWSPGRATVLAGAGAVVAGLTVWNDVPAAPGVLPIGVHLTEGGVTIRRCTLRGAGYVNLYVAPAGGPSGGHWITGNDIFHAEAYGVHVSSSVTTACRLEGNFVGENGNGIASPDATRLDLGGGSTGSLGGNTMSCNAARDLVVGDGALAAEGNQWDHAPPTVTSDGLQAGDIFVTGSATVETSGAVLASGVCP